MNEKNFVKSRLEEWSVKFPDIHLMYAYEKSTEYHIVVVEQIDAIKSNKEFRKEVRALHKEFDERFPDADIMISEPSDSYDLSGIVYENTIVRILATTVEKTSVHRTTQSLEMEFCDYKLWSSEETNIRISNCFVDRELSNNYALAA